MPNVIRSRTPSHQWPLWVAGAVAGVLASWLLLRPRADATPSGAAEGSPRGVRERWSAPRPRARAAAPAPDLTAITERLRARPGAEELRVRSLGGGILELVGSAPDELDLPAVLDELATAAGVSVVVNRVWTPSSGAP